MLIAGSFVPFASVPSESGALLDAVRWGEKLLLGMIGTTVAVIAVATFGFAMLGGRIDARRGVTIVVGCFILFGARTIAAGLRDAAAGASMRTEPPAFTPPPTYAVEPRAPAPAGPSVYDPYAGAAVPD